MKTVMQGNPQHEIIPVYMIDISYILPANSARICGYVNLMHWRKGVFSVNMGELYICRKRNLKT